MKIYMIGFIAGHSLKYHYESVIAETQEQAIDYLFSAWGSNFENIITSIIEKEVGKNEI